MGHFGIMETDRLMGVGSRGSASGKGEVIMGRCFPLDGPGATFKTAPVVRGVVYKENKGLKDSSSTTFGVIKKEMKSSMASANQSNGGVQGSELVINDSAAKDFSFSNSSKSIAHETDMKSITNQTVPVRTADGNTTKARLSRASARTVPNAYTEVSPVPRERSRLRFKEDSTPKREISAERVLVPPAVKQKVMMQNAGEKSSIRMLAAPRSHSYDATNANENRRQAGPAPLPAQKPLPCQKSCIYPPSVGLTDRVSGIPDGPSAPEPRYLQQEIMQIQQRPKEEGKNSIQYITKNEQEHSNVQYSSKKEQPVLKTILKDSRKSQSEEEKGTRQLTGKEAWEATQRKKALLREEFFRVPYEECNREALRGLGGRLNKSEPRMHLVGRERKKRNSFSCKRRVHFELDYLNDEKKSTDDESKPAFPFTQSIQIDQPQNTKSRSGRPTDLDELMKTMNKGKRTGTTGQNISPCSEPDQVQNTRENKMRVSKSLAESKLDNNHNFMKYDGCQHPMKKTSEVKPGLTNTSSDILVPTSYQILKSCTALPSPISAASTRQSTTCTPDGSHSAIGLSTQGQSIKGSHAASHSAKPSQSISSPPSISHSNAFVSAPSQSSNSSLSCTPQPSDLAPAPSPSNSLLSSQPTPERQALVTPTEQLTFSTLSQSSNTCLSTAFSRKSSGRSHYHQSEDQETQRMFGNHQKPFTGNAGQHSTLSSPKPALRETTHQQTATSLYHSQPERFYDHKRARSQTRAPDVELKSYHQVPSTQSTATNRTNKAPVRSRSSSFDKSYMAKISQNISNEPYTREGGNRIVYPEKSNKENVEAQQMNSKKTSIDDRGNSVNILMTKGESYSKHNIVLNSHVTSSTPKVTVKRIYVPVSSTPARSPPSPTPSCASSSCSFGSSGSSSGCFSGSPSPTPTPSPTRARASCAPTDL
ncbi:flocculation protein FLO11-like [Penaeus chinensis]|uniref:flocculation protein FLO11-like n=1 Tax=Penaeus chinensis TaxID=139456 RepID=UPI001FB750E7|nr:flocculation protein FLO11-like [Penaeus chinensis]XP_047502862.1 flocculation protein FLO11-like [Penaeus chinensis]XP_047502863.1 flocculation protein FLO11-like [Penaeus chinensis]